MKRYIVEVDFLGNSEYTQATGKGYAHSKTLYNTLADAEVAARGIHSRFEGVYLTSIYEVVVAVKDFTKTGKDFGAKRVSVLRSADAENSIDREYPFVMNCYVMKNHNGEKILGSCGEGGRRWILN